MSGSQLECSGPAEGGELRPIHNYPVVPEESALPRSGATPPVTRGELGADFRNGMYFPRWDSDIARQSFYDARLASYLWSQWYDNIEIREAREEAARAGETMPHWQLAAADHARRGLFVYFNSLATSCIDKQTHDKLVEQMGPLFLGHDEGEWDGAYICMIAAGQSPHQAMTAAGGAASPAAPADDIDPERSRRDACRHYLAWLRETYARHHNRMISVHSLCFGSHYAAEIGTRMLGIEPGESLPCANLLMTFCRGACKQYDLLMQCVPSVFSVRGVKMYPLQHQPQSVALSGHAFGPAHGTTLGLLKRLWWQGYMSGASLVGLQFGYFPTDFDGRPQNCLRRRAHGRAGDRSEGQGPSDAPGLAAVRIAPNGRPPPASRNRLRSHRRHAAP